MCSVWLADFRMDSEAESVDSSVTEVDISEGMWEDKHVQNFS